MNNKINKDIGYKVKGGRYKVGVNSKSITYLRYEEIEVGNSVVLEYVKGKGRGDFELISIRGKVVYNSKTDFRVVGYRINSEVKDDKINGVKLNPERDKFRVRPSKLPKEWGLKINEYIENFKVERKYNLRDELTEAFKIEAGKDNRFDHTELFQYGLITGEALDKSVKFILVVKGDSGLELLTFRNQPVWFKEIKHGNILYDTFGKNYYYTEEGRNDEHYMDDELGWIREKSKYHKLEEHKQVPDNQFKDLKNIFGGNLTPIQEYDTIIKQMGLDWGVMYTMDTYLDEDFRTFKRVGIEVKFDIKDKDKFRTNLHSFAQLVYRLHKP